MLKSKLNICKNNLLLLIVSVVLLLFMVFPLSACVRANNYDLPEVKEGETFEITLKARNMYSWQYKIPSSGIEYIAMEYIPTNNDPDIIGGGQNKFTFKATKAGSYKIKFELSAPWEPKKPPIEINIYKITVITSK